MAVQIIEKSHNSLYMINGKELYLNGDGNWQSRQELTTFEQNAFNLYRQAKSLS